MQVLTFLTLTKYAALADTSIFWGMHLLRCNARFHTQLVVHVRLVCRSLALALNELVSLHVMFTAAPVVSCLIAKRMLAGMHSCYIAVHACVAACNIECEVSVGTGSMQLKSLLAVASHSSALRILARASRILQ